MWNFADPSTKKSAKKNRKRKEKKRDGREGYTDSDDLPMLPQNMITVLREELEKAKSRRVCTSVVFKNIILKIMYE